jgi:hypothetical protein
MKSCYPLRTLAKQWTQCTQLTTDDQGGPPVDLINQVWTSELSQALQKQPRARPSTAAMLQHAWIRRHAPAAAAPASISSGGSSSPCGAATVAPPLSSATNSMAQHAIAAGAVATITVRPSATAKVHGLAHVKPFVHVRVGSSCRRGNR